MQSAPLWEVILQELQLERWNMKRVPGSASRSATMVDTEEKWPSSGVLKGFGIKSFFFLPGSPSRRIEKRKYHRHCLHNMANLNETCQECGSRAAQLEHLNKAFGSLQRVSSRWQMSIVDGKVEKSQHWHRRAFLHQNLELPNAFVRIAMKLRRNLYRKRPWNKEIL